MKLMHICEAGGPLLSPHSRRQFLKRTGGAMAAASMPTIPVAKGLGTQLMNPFLADIALFKKSGIEGPLIEDLILDWIGDDTPEENSWRLVGKNFVRKAIKYVNGEEKLVNQVMPARIVNGYQADAIASGDPLNAVHQLLAGSYPERWSEIGGIVEWGFRNAMQKNGKEALVSAISELGRDYDSFGTMWEAALEGSATLSKAIGLTKDQFIEVMSDPKQHHKLLEKGIAKDEADIEEITEHYRTSKDYEEREELDEPKAPEELDEPDYRTGYGGMHQPFESRLNNALRLLFENRIGRLSM